MFHIKRTPILIVLTIASSKIAKLMISDDKIAHSKFAIPLIVNEYFTCNITQGSALVELLIKTKLIT